MSGTPGWPPLPTPDDERRAAVFVARVARLDAASWGRLDALGARIAGGAPLARLQRARLDADLLSIARRLPPAVAATLTLGGRSLLDATAEAGALWRRVTREPSAAPPPPDAQAERMARHLAAFRAALRSQPAVHGAPSGGRAAERGLEYALHALLLRAALSDDGFARLYGLVEPVIPFASLDEGSTAPALPPAPRADG